MPMIYKQQSFHRNFRRKTKYCDKHYWIRLVYGRCSACEAERGVDRRVIDPESVTQEELNKMPFNPLSAEGRLYSTVVAPEGSTTALARGDEGVPKPSERAPGRSGEAIISDFHWRRMYPYARR